VASKWLLCLPPKNRQLCKYLYILYLRGFSSGFQVASLSSSTRNQRREWLPPGGVYRPPGSHSMILQFSGVENHPLENIKISLGQFVDFQFLILAGFPLSVRVWFFKIFPEANRPLANLKNCLGGIRRYFIVIILSIWNHLPTTQSLAPVEIVQIRPPQQAVFWRTRAFFVYFVLEARNRNTKIC